MRILGFTSFLLIQFISTLYGYGILNVEFQSVFLIPFNYFKIRKRKTPVATVVTLRGVRLYAFLDRLINLAVPRIRDFQGVNYERFDGYGNYSIGFKEQVIFPEIDYEKIKIFHGITLSIVTSAPNDTKRRILLELLGIPFKK